MTDKKEIINLMRELFPESNRCDFGGFEDNIGLLVGSENGQTDTALCCLDVTNAVIDEAASMGCKLIISHHPVIFSSVKSVTDTTERGEKLIRLISNGISVYSAHTNMDFSFSGINRYAAELIGLTNLRILEPYISENEGLGIVGDLKKPLKASEFLPEVSAAFKDEKASLYGKSTDGLIKRVAVLNGGGGGDTAYIDAAKNAGADCLVTGDIKHHVGLYAAEIGLYLVEIQHYLCEKAFIPVLCDLINKSAQKSGLKFTACPSKMEVNPRIL